MKRTSRHLICIISAFLLSCSLFGQGTADKDDVLNQYELACRECLELKKRVEAGEKVARKEATERLDLFVALNSRIKSESLTSGQLTRFEAINLWFSSGVRPLVLDHESLPRIFLCTTDIPRIHETDSLADFRSSYIPAEKSVKNRFRTYLTAVISVPETAFGGMAGLQYRDWGGYLRFKGRFNSASPSYSCLSDGSLADSGMAFWPGGNACRKTLTATAGALYGLSEWLCVYGGLGYGQSILLWEDIEEAWAQVDDLSFRGVAVEAGVMGSWRFLTLGLGVSTTAFSTVALDICVGFNF